MSGTGYRGMSLETAARGKTKEGDGRKLMPTGGELNMTCRGDVRNGG